LEAELNEEDTSEIIFNQIGKTLGKAFYEIEADEKASRYVIV